MKYPYLSIPILAGLCTCVASLAHGAETDSLRTDLQSGERELVLKALETVYQKRIDALYEDVYTAFSTSEDPYVRRAALFKMSERQSPALPKMIREALDDPKADGIGSRHLGSREIATRLVEKTGDDDLIFRMIQRGLDDTEIYYRKQVVWVLASSPSIQLKFADRLAAIAHDPSNVIRFTFFGRLKFDEASAKLTLPLVKAAILGDKPGDRIAAAFALREYPNWAKENPAVTSELVNHLVKDLANPDTATAGGAAAALSCFWGWPETKDAVGKALSSGDAPTRVWAATVFQDCGLPIDANILQPSFADGTEEIQLRLMAVLAAQASTDTIPIFAKALESDSLSVRKAAVFGLRAVGWIGDFTEVAPSPDSEPVSMIRLKVERSPEEEARFVAASGALKVAAAKLDSDPIVADLASQALNWIGATKRDWASVLIDLAGWNQAADSRQERHLNDSAGREIADGDVLNIGFQKQLFVDDFVIDKLDGTKRLAHQFVKHPANPILQAEAPWEENWLDPFMCSVHYDESTRSFKMWYRCGANHTLGAFAVSKDGIEWQRPDLGRVDYYGSKHNNLLGWSEKLHRSPHQPGHNIVIQPDAPPEQRYLSFFDYPGKQRGFHVSYSPDGLSWTEPEHAQMVYGDVASLITDPLRGGQVLFAKQALWIDGYRRSFGVSHLKEPKSVAPKVYAFTGLTEQHDELVGPVAAKSFGMLAPKTLDPVNGSYGTNWHTQIYSVTGLIYEGLTFGFYDLWYLTGKKEGPLDIHAKVSRDLTHWTDLGYPVPTLPTGRVGEWDPGMVYGCSNILVIDDEIRYYYAGYNLGHYTGRPWGSVPHQIMGVGLATMRLDGFASLRAETAGTVTTKPFLFSGQRLEINAAAEGSIRVEILDAGGAPLEGFVSEPIQGDDLRHAVSWQDGAKLGDLAGKPIRLRFHLEKAHLYAFQFRG